MPNDLRLRVASLSVTVPLNGSDAQVAAALTRFANSLGIPVNGTPAENLTAILEHVRDDVRRRAKAVQVAELRAANEAAIAATADSDNAL